MNPLLIGFYRLLKLLVKAVLRIFYPYTTYIHAGRLNFDHPAILISNHPNTLMDPLVVAAKCSKLVNFLANAGLFKSNFGNWFFNTFYCIPVQRPQDKEGKKKVSNEDSFARANEHLKNGGVLFIAAEGTSEMERRLRPLKTGTARIALSTEKKHGYATGVAIIPVGLTYYNPDKCGSRLVVSVGKAIFPKDYQTQYESDSVATVRSLTADLEDRMKELMIDTADEQEDLRLRMLEAICQTDYPMSGEARFNREMQLLNKIGSNKDSELSALLDEYRESLQSFGLKDWVLQKGKQLRFSLVDFLSLPLYLYGKINNFLPTMVPVWITKRLKLYPGYDATIKVLSSLITFPLFYWIQGSLIEKEFGEVLKWLYLISLPISGIIAWKLAERRHRLKIARRFRKLPKAQKTSLQEIRAEIVDVMQALS